MGDRRASFESYGEPDAPPAYASLSSPLVAQHGFQPAEQHILHPAFDHAFSQLNLPRGYFLLRNVAQGKTLDLLGHKQHEGAELGLHPIKQPQLQGLSLQHRQNNQLLFVDWDGHLVSAAASRAIEVEGEFEHPLCHSRLETDDPSCSDSRLTLAFPHPITTYPSSLSHPIPRFRLDPVTSTLHVLFGYDPSFLGPDDSPDQQNDYIVEAVPLKRRPSEATVWSTPPILSGLGSRAAELGGRIGAFVGGRFSAPASPNPLPGLEKDELPPPPPPEKAPEKDVPPVPSTSTSELPDLPAKPSVKLAEGSTGQSFVEEEDSDSDTEPSAYRPVRVVRLESGWREKFPAEALRSAPDPSFGVTRWTSSSRELRMWRRRQWHVIPVTVQPVPAPDGFLVPSPSASEVFTRSRSSSSYFGASSSSGIDDSPGASDENDDTLSYDVPHRSSLARDDPLTQPPNVSHRWSASQALTAGSIAAASHLSGLISSRFVPSATRQLPLPPSPPLPRVPSDLAQPHVSKEDAFDPGSTPRPDDADEWADANVLRSGDISDLGHASGTASSVELVGGSAQASAQESPQESEQEETADVDEESVKTGDVLAKADIEKASVVQADERADSGGPQDEKVLSVREVKASERPEAAEDKQDLGPALVAGNASEGQTESV
ncbi:ricin B-related lectin domain protein [Rhodotorula toruloides]|uniref:Ricin B-related lectin domain protein n=1 Tax=Rhodotorula toruloides TaxID=5286 RepID=A0A511KEM9_RHOTO|nr:ricin B-related lectin domain protein [Rhodotorula toruloides]